MHDIKAIRDNPALYDAAWARRGLSAQTPAILDLDRQVRGAVTAKQEAETARNAASKQIGAAKAQKNEEEAQRLMAEVASLKTRIEEAGAAEADAVKKLHDIVSALPNRPDSSVPDGTDEHGNIELRRWYKTDGAGPPALDLTADHVTLGEALGMMDFEAAARMSGARFVALKGPLARLERALAAFMLDLQTGTHGYTEVSPPLLVNKDAAFGTGQLPKFSPDLFETRAFDWVKMKHDLTERIQNEVEQLKPEWTIQLQAIMAEFPKPENRDVVTGFLEKQREILSQKFLPVIHGEVDSGEFHRFHYLIPTAEVSLTNLVLGQILDEAALPMRMTADTPCFRSEAGSAGRDTRGMIRMHQFRKVELVTITTPDQSHEEHERMTACAEEVLKRLDLPYRVMLLCAGDMGFTAQRTYDLEVWLPSQGTYREISSCSNCGDFQARRMDARYRPAGGKPEFVHTLNGSGLAVGRTLVAVLENYQNADGSITVPDALVPYMGGMRRIERAQSRG